MYKDVHGFNDFLLKEQRKIEHRKSLTFNEKVKQKAIKQNVYSGKRFLGHTPNCKEVWISMRYSKKDSTLQVRVDSGFNHLIRPMLYGSHHEIINISNINKI